MNQFDLISRLGKLPMPHDSNQVRLGLERFRDAAAECEDAGVTKFAASFVEQDAGRALLAAVFGNSPFLSSALIREIVFFREMTRKAPDLLLEETLRQLPSPHSSTEMVMDGLRQAKRRVALLTAIADIGGIWSLEAVTGALSRLAGQALHIAAGHALLRLEADGELKLRSRKDPCKDSGLAILGMGKLGAFELNYSSDIDIMVFYDQDTIRYTGSREPRDAFVKLTRSVVKLMQERTAEGYVFRTDLRLRPDPAATPVAMSMETAELYYETLGQNWERAAMIKARCVAGDLPAGDAFLLRIAPFVWRKNLDFAAIEDIHSIKRQIHAHRGFETIAVAGHNIKVGRGGIREIEFFAQTQQLILGGRLRQLRNSSTCGALRALVEVGRLKASVADEMIEAYEFLRQVEHRLQMVADEQTQTLPEDDDGLRRIALFMGHSDFEGFAAALTARLALVQRHYAALFETSPALGTSEGNLVFTGTEDDPETIRTLSQMGFGEPSSVAETIRGWHHGRFRAMRSVRARELLTALMPRLLKALARTASPDDAFKRFDQFLSNLPSGVQLFSLFYNNPDLLDLVADIMGSAPRLAERLGRQPGLLDGVITADYLQPLPSANQLAKELGQYLSGGRDFQDLLDFTRRWANDQRFRVGVQTLRGAADTVEQGRALSAVADAVLRNLMNGVQAEFQRNYGRVKGGEMVLIGLGKLGAGEMTFGSDLDLIFVYDHDPDAEQSDGKTALPASQYFGRLSQRIINALTALTAEGVLYEVDMRLRPSGNKGPVAVHFDGMARYHREESWTWEHMALTRARVVCGPKALGARVEALIREVLIRPRDPERLAADVRDMHEKLMAQHGTRDTWNIKHTVGGLLDVEFTAQYLILKHAATQPDVIAGNAAEVYRRLGRFNLLEKPLAQALAADTLLLRTVQGILRLCFDARVDGGKLPLGLQRLLASAGGAADFAALEEKLVATQQRVAAAYDRLLEVEKAKAAAK